LGTIPPEQHFFTWCTKMGGEVRRIPVFYLQQGLVARLSGQRKPTFELF
jgi:hypothetical protein